jgi:serine/threonine protein kinase
VLGEGGTAVVYRCYDHDRKIWVAVKLLHRREAKTPRTRQRFLDEARVLSSLEHRNVIRVLDVVGDAARPFFVMEHAEAGSLMQWVRRYGALPAHIAVDLAIQICKGAGAAHKIGVIHRDLKPHNVLLTKRGACKVTDFGIAQLPRRDGTTDVPDAITHTNVSGTLGYMAPEQRKDPRSVDTRTDVYGIGATLFTLLTAQTVVDLFIAEREPHLLEGLPDVLIPVLRKATAYRVDDRQMNAQELARELFEAREHLVITGPEELDIPQLEDPEPPPRPPAEAPEVVPSDTGAFRRKPATTPPTSLSTLTPMPVERLTLVEPQRNPWPLVAGAAALVAALPIGTLEAGAIGVRIAANQVGASRIALYETLDAELAIVDDLGALGADGDALESLYKEQRNVDPEARPWVAARYVEALDRDVQAHAAALSQRDAAKARERMARIAAAKTATDNAVLLWEARGDSALGRVAVRIGLAPAP